MSKIKFFLIVFLVSLGIVISNFRFLYMAGGDLSIYVNPASLWNDTAYAWSQNLTNLLGWSNLSVNLAMPFILFFKFFSFLPDLFAEYAYFSAVFCAIFFASFYFFYNYLFSKDKYISVISSLAYIFNAFFFVYFLNYNSHLSFIILPLLFILCHQVLENNFKKLIVTILLISALVPSAFTNPPVVIPLFFAAFSYLIFLIIKKGGIDKKIITGIFVAVAAFVLVNLWWILPFIYTSYSNQIGEKIGSALRGGIFRTASLYDAFRFLGKWSFGVYYLEFKNSVYDYLYLENPIFILCNYLVLMLAYASIVYKKNRNIIYFMLLSLAGLFFAKGDLKPLGDWYLMFLNKFPNAYMFREPQAKFMLIHAFSISALLGYFLFHLKNNKNFVYKKVSYLVLSAILIPSLPFIIGGFVPRGSFGPIRSYLLEIPESLREYEKYQAPKKLEYRILSTPRNTGTYLWESGFNINNSALKPFSSKPVLSYADLLVDYFTPELDSFFKALYGNLEAGDSSAVRFLALANVREVVQENSKDWRWSKFAKKPNEMSSIFEKYRENNSMTQTKEFGYFSPAYLSRIDLGVPADDSVGKLPLEVGKEELIKDTNEELLNKPELAINKIKDELFLPKFYTPENIVVSSRLSSELSRILSQENHNARLAVFFENQSSDGLKIASNSEGNKLPVLEFKKINPTKYRIRIHGARGHFPLIFSENFHRGWKIYINQNSKTSCLPEGDKSQSGNLKSKIDSYKILYGNDGDQADKGELIKYMKSGWVSTLGDGKEKMSRHKKSGYGEESEYVEKYKIDFVSKNFQGTVQNDNLPKGCFWETWLQKPIDGNENHLVVNGYANSWLIDPEKICSGDPGLCVKNSDGSYDLEAVVEFWPQRIFYVSLLISSMALLACLGYLGYYWRKRKIAKN